MNKKIFTQFIIVSYTILAIHVAFSQNTNVIWYSFNMRYAELKSGNTMVKSVVGQNFVGTTQQSNTQIISGFLADTLFRNTVLDGKNQEQLPASYSLWQNYPNPFNPTTTIHFELPKESHVNLKVYNMLGQEVLMVLDEQKDARRYDLRIDGTLLASGVFFYRLVAGDYVSTKKLLLLK
ncbi:MAG: T9SS type A sorting domain-containing protein [Ignavibacteriales bacterium]|nr:T9SS type A sorting domain-containing protein [Ignavibacteriales bacterium]